MSSPPQNKDLSLSSDAFELKFSDLNDQVEMSLLDKEVAEERFEAAQAALDAATERVAELEIEVAVLKEENCESLRFFDERNSWWRLTRHFESPHSPNGERRRR